jgi:hypothetical protein
MSLKFTRIAAKMIRTGGLSNKAASMLRVLADRADKNGRSFARQIQLAEDCQCSERTARAALAELEAKCFIEREARWRKTGKLAGSRTSDLITVLDAAGAARAAERLLMLPLMVAMDGGANRQILPVVQPANPAGYCEPITLTESINQSPERRRA